MRSMWLMPAAVGWWSSLAMGAEGATTRAAKPAAGRIEQYEVVPAVVESGQAAVLRIRSSVPKIAGVEVRQTYYVAKEQVPPSFTYDPKEITGFLLHEGKRLLADNGAMDTDAVAGQMTIRLDTAGWRSGLYHLQVTLNTGQGGKGDERYAVLKVRSPADRLEVRVSESWRACKGTHVERMLRLANGTLLHGDHFSLDGGKTWQKRETGTIGAGAMELRDGRVLGMMYRTLPIEGREGWFRGERFESLDHGKTVQGPLDVQFHVPQAKAAQGHAFHPGPLFMRSIVERKDGSLVALMAGWFKGDDTPCPHSPKRPYSRTYVCESSDGGKTWEYLTTIGYDRIGSEGYNEGAMRTVPDGRLMAVMRTGSMRDRACQDNPVMQSFSADGGRTWSAPARTGGAGAFPDLCVLSDGTLAASCGRPGANIMFSTDAGKTWTDHTSVDATPYSGYTSLCEVAPGQVLMIFGARDYLDPATGQRSNDIRVATISYRPKAKSSGVGPLDRLQEAGVAVSDLGEGCYECEVRFEALSRPEKFSLHLPEDYDPTRKEPYPLILFLHGAGRHHRSLIDAPETRSTLRQSRSVIVLPNGGNSWWIDSPAQPASKYQSYLTELIGLIDRQLHVSKAQADRAIGGWSMGGFGSANFVGTLPDSFGAWASIVGLLDFPNPAYPKEHNHDVPPILGAASDWPRFNPLTKADAMKGKRILLITAESAFDRKMNETFAARLKELGIPHQYKMLPGGHTFAVVAAAMDEVMRFLENTAQS